MCGNSDLVPVSRAGVIHKTVNSAVARLRGIHQLLPVLSICDVCFEERYRIRSALRYSLSVALIDVGNKNFCSFLGELVGDTLTEAMSSALRMSESPVYGWKGMLFYL